MQSQQMFTILIIVLYPRRLPRTGLVAIVVVGVGRWKFGFETRPDVPSLCARSRW